MSPRLSGLLVAVPVIALLVAGCASTDDDARPGVTPTSAASSSGSGDESDIVRALRQGAGDSISQTGQQIVSRQLNIAPTLTIQPGFPVRVIVTRDLVLEPYGG